MSQSRTPRSDAAWSRLVALRESGYMGRVDQDGYAVTDDVPVDVPTQYPARPWHRATYLFLTLMTLALIGVWSFEQHGHTLPAMAAAVATFACLIGVLVCGNKAIDIDNDHLVGEYTDEETAA